MNALFNNVEFEHPLYLDWCWVGLAFVAIVCVLGYLYQRALRNAYSRPENLNRTTRAISVFGFGIKILCWEVVAFLLTLTLAGPYKPDHEVVVPEGSIHLVAAFDVSISMAAEDYRYVIPTEDGSPAVGPWGSRLQMAKLTFITQVFNQIPGNKLGLVTFAGQSNPQAPLCEDYSTLRWILTDTGWMGILSAPGDGSDYVAGLKTSIQTLRRDFDPDKTQVIMLFTDGGLPKFESDKDKVHWEREYRKMLEELDALRKSSKRGLHVLVVGVGGKKKVRVPLYDSRTMQRIDWFPPGKHKKARLRSMRLS